MVVYLRLCKPLSRKQVQTRITEFVFDRNVEDWEIGRAEALRNGTR